MEKNKTQEQYKYDESQKRRVAVYMRVSTDYNQQISSYELQRNYYNDYLSKHSLWTLVALYSDEEIAGISVKTRDSFNRMIKDCEEGKIDIIVVKSISRFAKNIDDCINTVKKLLALPNPVGVYFETENIYTLNPNIFMYLDMYKKISEEESKNRTRNFGYPTNPLLRLPHPEDRLSANVKKIIEDIIENEGGDTDGNNPKQK